MCGSNKVYGTCYEKKKDSKTIMLFLVYFSDTRNNLILSIQKQNWENKPVKIILTQVL